jgi:hypothetical protein
LGDCKNIEISSERRDGAEWTGYATNVVHDIVRKISGTLVPP